MKFDYSIILFLVVFGCIGWYEYHAAAPTKPTEYELRVSNHGYDSIRTVGTFYTEEDCVKVRSHYIKTDESMVNSYWCEPL